MSRLPLLLPAAEDGVGFWRADFQWFGRWRDVFPLMLFYLFWFWLFWFGLPTLALIFLMVNLSFSLWDFVCCVLNNRNMFITCYVKISHFYASQFSLPLWKANNIQKWGAFSLASTAALLILIGYYRQLRPLHWRSQVRWRLNRWSRVSTSRKLLMCWSWSNTLPMLSQSHRSQLHKLIY